MLSVPFQLSLNPLARLLNVYYHINDALLYIFTSGVYAGLQPLSPFDKHCFQYLSGYSIQNVADFRDQVVLLHELGPSQLAFNIARQKEVGRDQVRSDRRMYGCTQAVFLHDFTYPLRAKGLGIVSMSDQSPVRVFWTCPENLRKHVLAVVMNIDCRSFHEHVDIAEAFGVPYKRQYLFGR
jgi:hypothetical protein